MDYDMINKMKVAELKDFLRLRALKVTGKKCELVARAFAAVEFNIPISKTAEEIEGEIADEYKNKLSVDGKTLPDPFVLKTGWKNEEEGICFWPMVTKLHCLDLKLPCDMACQIQHAHLNLVNGCQTELM